MKIFFGALLVLFSFAENGSRVVVRAQTSSASERRDLGLIKKVQGPVCVRKGGQGECQPTRRGATLRKGDILRVEESGVATVRCYCPPPKQEPNTNPRYEDIPCPNSCPRSLGTGRIAAISSLRPDALTLRIPPLAGAIAYSITISGPNMKWSTDIRSQKFSLPANAPKLDPGVTYALSVADKRSPEQIFPAINISLLNEEEAGALSAIEKEIRELDLTDIEKQILVAKLYATWGINIDALNILESVQVALSKQEWDKIPVDLLLTIGDLYLSVGRADQASENYLKAYELSKKANDLTQQGYALEGFAVALTTQGKVKDANTRFRRAIIAFEKAGDTGTASRLNKRLQGGPLLQ